MSVSLPVASPIPLVVTPTPVPLVVAKAPVPGEVKTRLATRVGAEVAADLAAAAFLDTLDLVQTAFGHDRPVVALAGDLAQAARRDELTERLADCDVVAQRGDSFAERLANAYADLPSHRPVLQIGMDTPHLDPTLLTKAMEDMSGRRGVIGPAEDGGWWLLGLADPDEAPALTQVPMSRCDTCERTLAALGHLDLAVTTLAYDVDTYVDAERAASDAPMTRFARAWTAR